jgi:hypothetical protein
MMLRDSLAELRQRAEAIGLALPLVVDTSDGAGGTRHEIRCRASRGAHQEVALAELTELGGCACWERDDSEVVVMTAVGGASVVAVRSELGLLEEACEVLGALESGAELGLERALSLLGALPGFQPSALRPMWHELKPRLDSLTEHVRARLLTGGESPWAGPGRKTSGVVLVHEHNCKAPWHELDSVQLGAMRACVVVRGVLALPEDLLERFGVEEGAYARLGQFSAEVLETATRLLGDDPAAELALVAEVAKALG